MAILPDYTSGLISLANGSVTVTGTGTLFKTVGLKAGATLLIQNLTAVIVSVDSNTKLTLAEPWTGTSLVNKPYRARFLPDGTTVTATTAALIEMLGNGNLEALAGVTGAANTMPYFTGVGTMAQTSLTPYGRTLISRTTGEQVYNTLGVIPNGPLPSRLKEVVATVADANDANTTGWYIVNGISPNAPPIGISYMQVFRHTPTFMTQIAYARDNFRMARRFMINGVWGGWQELTPVRGSNANGEFVRFADGTQICWGSRSGIPLSGPTAVEFVLPASFIDGLYSIAATVVSATPNSFHPITIIGLGLSLITLAVENSAGTGTASVRWSATGRWF